MAQEDPELVALDSDSTLTDIDELMLNNFSSCDNIEDLIKSSDNELSSCGNIEVFFYNLYFLLRVYTQDSIKAFKQSYSPYNKPA